MYYTYVLRCRDGSLYTGVAKDMFSRMRDHARGGKKSAKYTRSHPILRLEALWSSRDRREASRLEERIKRLSKEEKESLVRDGRLLPRLIPEAGKSYVYHPRASLALFLGEITLPDLL